jgi:hypothetical protein
MRPHIIFVSALFVVNGNCATLARDSDLTELLAQSRPAIQEQIKKVYSIYLNDNPENECAALQEVLKLKVITKDKGEIVKQLAIFVATTTSEEDIHLFAAGGMLDQLELPASIPIRVLAPYLHAENEKLRSFALGWFHSHDGHRAEHLRTPLASLNYHQYMEYVGVRLARGEEIPDAFIEYIFERHPGKALLVFAYANHRAVAAGKLLVLREAFEARRQGREIDDELRQQNRQQEEFQQFAKEKRNEILLAEHIVHNAIWLEENGFRARFQTAWPEAMAELDKLARHKEWWARLYVAHIMSRHPELRQPEVVQQLSKDLHPLVSAAAKSIAQ